MLYENAFRLFISSTFSDFAIERESLRTRVFPEILAYCAEQGGLSFQPIDLRWGVSEEAQLDQKTLDLCLNEVRTCKSYPAPNFIILSGDRYGWVPLPYAIEADEFELLRSAMGETEQHELLQWYRKDENQIPVSYNLEERSGDYVSPSVWAAVEDRLRRSLQNAVIAQQLPDQQRQKYFLSATEAEVLEGILEFGGAPTAFQQHLIDEGLLHPGVDPENVFAFIRSIRGELEGSIFTDAEREKAQRFKTNIRETVANCYETETELLAPDRLDTGYIERFAEQVIAFLKQRVDVHVAMRSQRTDLQTEIDAHTDFRHSKLTNFLGRSESRDLIRAYVTGKTHPAIEHPRTPLVVYGPSGRGKSALMAKAIEECAANREIDLVYRFVGATPTATSSREILLSVFHQLGINPDEHMSEEDLKNETFEQFSERIRDLFLGLAERPGKIVVFIDAVDQLEHDDPFIWIPETVPENVKIVVSALNDEHYPSDSRYYQHLATRRLNLHEVPPFDQPLELMRGILASYHRRLQPHQEAYLLRQYASSQSPFFIYLAAEELRHWKSTESVADDKTTAEGNRVQDLSGTQQDLVREFISNLKDFYHHNARFVTRILGFIHASRDGLSEGELLQLISTDSAFVREMAPDTWHQNTTGELPTVIWSRLSAQLRRFFRQSSVDGEVLISFFHREFAQAIAEHPRQQQEHRAAITACQEMIRRYQQEDFDANRWGPLYATLITEWELRYPEDSQLQEDAEFVAGLEDEWAVQFSNLVSEYGGSSYQKNRIKDGIAFFEVDYYLTSEKFANDPLVWSIDYVTAMGNLSPTYREMDRTEDAIRVGEERIAVQRRLPVTDRGFEIREFIDGLRDLAHSYKDANRFEDALLLQKEAISILKDLYDTIPSQWADDYAASLEELADSYGHIGPIVKMTKLHDEAIPIRQEILFHLKTLYESSAERWIIEYEGALRDLARVYGNDGRTAEALELEAESLQLLRKMVRTDPDRWIPDYAQALSNHAFTWSEIQKWEKAIEFEKESLSLWKPLYESTPERWANGCATSLNSLAYLYSKVDRIDDAVRLQSMGLQILKDRFLTNPERWYGDYVEALANSKDLCIDSDRIDEAIKIAEHDRVIRGDLYLSNPERWAEDYVIALSHLGGLYSHVNRSDEAIALTKERLEILKPLYEKDPEQWAEDYMIVLRDLAVLYRKIGRSHESKDLRKLRRRIDRGRTQPSGFVFLHRIRDKMQIFGFGRSHSDQDARASEHTE